MQSVQMIGKWVMIKEHPIENLSKGGIIINPYGIKGDAGKAAEYFHGTVESVSEKVPELKKGDHVIFDCYSGGYDVEMNGEEYFVTKPSNVWVVIEGASNAVETRVV